MPARPPILLLPLLALLACRGDEQRTGSIEREDFAEARRAIDPLARLQIDSGNVAYREDRYQDALRHYEAATLADEEAAAAWFGVFMAQRALGDAVAADAALRQAREVAPGATLVMPELGEQAAPPAEEGGAP